MIVANLAGIQLLWICENENCLMPLREKEQNERMHLLMACLEYKSSVTKNHLLHLEDLHSGIRKMKSDMFVICRQSGGCMICGTMLMISSVYNPGKDFNPYFNSALRQRKSDELAEGISNSLFPKFSNFHTMTCFIARATTNS
ncbi:hypothetical protein QQP08_004329 [Theobroma cacao]|nr:hypothetical protein QQP08_004329 [Theobroma cacao]